MVFEHPFVWIPFYSITIALSFGLYSFCPDHKDPYLRSIWEYPKRITQWTYAWHLIFVLAYIAILVIEIYVPSIEIYNWIPYSIILFVFGLVPVLFWVPLFSVIFYIVPIRFSRGLTGFRQFVDQSPFSEVQKKVLVEVYDLAIASRRNIAKQKEYTDLVAHLVLKFEKWSFVARAMMEVLR